MSTPATTTNTNGQAMNQKNTNPEHANARKQVSFSGMQPSAGSLHLGNYIGALTQWRAMQDEYDCYFCVVNLHAITVAQNPRELLERTRLTAAQYIAAGIDPERSTLFVQSQVSAHTELAWVLNTITGFGEASRMTQFKDKSQRFGAENASVGLFTYPMLMAADILLYNTDIVPVGEDQKQHVELTRNLAQRFNSRYKKTFRVPEPSINTSGARVYDLQQPNTKMSKSASSDAGIINLLDDPKVTRKKIMRAVTDADGEIRYDRERKPGVSQLLTLLSVFGGKPIDSLEQEFSGRGYGDLKKEVADCVEAEFAPVRERTFELLNDAGELDRILAQGAEKARSVAQKTLQRVYEAIGLSAKQ